ncbi:MAG: hypothetical protein WC455_22885 [Dehalococcoidia bacterium]
MRILNYFKRARPCKVLVHLDNYEGGIVEKEIVIPDGYTFTTGFAEKPTLRDRKGRKVKEWDWRPGYQVEIEFLYE